ncbi:MAG: PD-(D/E)XK nuclease family protein [Candidatus Aminicenantes bacterium]|nr:PD-(D/E)XK nuclease family protein [Candidatus Aminicenantes bacterium]
MREYSHSQLEKFETCPLQYKFVYVDRLRRYEEGVEAFLGQRFHETMERLYRERAFRLVPLEELLDFYEKAWAKKWHAAVRIRKEGRTADEYRLIGRRCIEDYYRRYGPFDEGRILGLERTIRFSLDKEGRYGFKGVIDRLMKAPDGAFEIHDYKAGGTLPEQSKFDTDRQLAIYQVGVQELWPEAKDVRLIWHYVAFDMEMRSSRTPEELEALKDDTMRLIDRIESETEFRPNESALCDWCSYWDLCPLKKHLVKVEGLPENEWKNEPGVRIVDAYAERWRKKRVLEAEKEVVEKDLEKLREAAVAFAEKEGVRVIAGSDARLRVNGKEKIVSPGKGTAEREALEKELRELGVWDEVSTLDPYALERALAEGRWAGETLERVRSYVAAEKRWTVTLRENAKEDE